MSMKIPDWVPDAAFYQIFPERFHNGDPRNDPAGTVAWGGMPDRENFFGGDLAGIVEKLDYIAGMGFNALYLNPIFRAGTNHKYDTHDYFAIDPAFGDDAAFDRLVREAHAREMRVVLDGVFNHCGLGFEPFQDLLRKGEGSRYRDWFQAYGYPVITTPVPNYATCGGAHYLPRLNTANPEVEAFVHEVALHWLGRGVDGWRLDVPYEIATDFWRRFRAVVKEAYPDAYLVAEEWRDPAPFLRGDTFDGATHYLLRGLAFDFLIKNALTGEAFSRSLETLWSQLPKGSESGMLTLLGGHDTPRLMTECGGDIDLAILLFTFLLTMPGAPMIYYGDENGMEGADDPDCRRPMVWQESQWQPRLRSAVKRLVETRRRHACLRRGILEAVFASDRVYAYSRSLDGENALVVLNNSLLPRAVTVIAGFPDGTVLEDTLSGRGFAVCHGHLEFAPLEPRTPLVLLPRS
jgi:cyclomaltodextrinase